jgi:hypothetical protein
VLGGLAATAVTGLVTGTGSAAQARDHGRFPYEIALPDGFRPEGITSSGRRLYVGSVAGNGIWVADVRTGEGEILVPRAPETLLSLRGLLVDRRSELLWAVGTETGIEPVTGPVGVVHAYERADGSLVRRYEVSGAGFLNDLVITDDAVWVTDSAVNVLTRISLRRRGRPGDEVQSIPLSGDWPVLEQGQFGANGIRELDRDTLIVNNSTTGGLYAVNKETGVATLIPVTGATLTGGDGLELRGSRLFDVRGSGDAVVDVLKLRRRSGEWTAEWQYALTSTGLDVPSTATIVGNAVYAVNARFGVADPDAATYTVTRLEIRDRDRGRD